MSLGISRILVVLRMTKLNELSKAKTLSFLVYGDSGVGKTAFGGAADVGGNTVIFNLGKTETTLTSNWFRQTYPKANPDIIRISEDLVERGLHVNPQAFNKLCEELDRVLEDPTINIIVIDDLTGLSQISFNKAIFQNKKYGKSRTLENAIETKSVPSRGIQDIGENIAVLNWFFHTYNNLCRDKNKHLIVLAHARKIYGKPANPKDITGEPTLKKIIPMAPGKDTFAIGELPAYFDEVYYMLISEGVNRVLVTKGSGSILAKTSHEKELDKREVNQTFTSILRKIQDASV